MESGDYDKMWLWLSRHACVLGPGRTTLPFPALLQCVHNMYSHGFGHMMHLHSLRTLSQMTSMSPPPQRRHSYCPERSFIRHTTIDSWRHYKSPPAKDSCPLPLPILHSKQCHQRRQKPWYQGFYMLGPYPFPGHLSDPTNLAFGCVSRCHIHFITSSISQSSLFLWLY